MHGDAYLITYHLLTTASGIERPLHEDVSEEEVIVIARPDGQRPEHYDPEGLVRAYIERLCEDPAVRASDIRIWKLTSVRVREERSIHIEKEEGGIP